MIKRKSFTLIELMVVIAIIGILGVVITPVVKNAIEKARIARIISTIKTLETVCQIFTIDNIRIPANADELFTQLAGLTTWDGPYIKAPLSSSINPSGGAVELRNDLDTATTGGDGFDLNSDGIINATATGNYLSLAGMVLSLARKIDFEIDNNVGHGTGHSEITGFDPNVADLHIFIFDQDPG
jgi:prepilin-type N-terminal cleavage/methylation domain-containing protein